VLYLLNQKGSASSQLQEAIRRFPDAPQLQFLRAQILEQDGKNHEAARVYETALRKHPDAGGFLLQGLLLGKMRAPQPSRTAFLNALKLDPRNPEALYLNGRVLVEKGPESHAAARQYLEQALALQPQHTEARYYLGVLKLRGGDAAGAARELEQVIQAQPDRIDARQNYAKALRQSGDVKNAAVQETTAGELVRLDARHSQLSNRVSLRPNDPEAHSDLGEFYLQHGALPRAVREFERALALKPGHARAKAGLEKAGSAAP
jgi:Flp pilus assembly protein TadD